MADTIDNATATATATTPLPQENTTAASLPPPQEIPVPMTETKRWVTKKMASLWRTWLQQDKVAAELNVEALTIDDTKTLTSLRYHQSLTSPRFEFLYLPDPN
ncbi:hypothetical protein SO802_028804 [Lithocarpus litseifolius]|uniref:Uncharacterized protein n=1 Tax=Lithocarpus litseifolius TaxID=425828 RepID=A0AAW2BRA6_9ROSI